jgi:hypothetical protein
MKMMLQWLVLLTLFVHASLAFRLYNEINGMFEIEIVGNKRICIDKLYINWVH